MKSYTVKAERIPQRKREQLAAPLLTLVREAFEDPQIQKEFEAWKEKRRLQTAEASA